MKYTARDENRVANIAQACGIFVTRSSSRAVYFHTNQNGSACFKRFIVFYTNLTHLQNKQWI